MIKVPGGNELLKPIELLERSGIGYNQTVADLGCGGRGYFTLQAARMVGDNGIVYAVDVLKSALTSVAGLAKQSGIQNIQTVWSNLELYGATKIPAASVDLALLVNILFQSSKRKEILHEATRLMKPKAKLLIVDWKPSGSPLGPPMGERVSPESLRQFAKELQLEALESFQAGQFHFGLLFSKR